MLVQGRRAKLHEVLEGGHCRAESPKLNLTNGAPVNCILMDNTRVFVQNSNDMDVIP